MVRPSLMKGKDQIDILLTILGALSLLASLAAPSGAYQRLGATERVSVASGGRQANGSSVQPSITPNARYVAFTSRATDLVPGDVNGVPDVFFHNRMTGETQMASVASNGSLANGVIPCVGSSGSGAPSISATGRYVAFESCADNLVEGPVPGDSGDTNGVQDVFVRDMKRGETIRVSVGKGGSQANSLSYKPSISGNGRYIAFESSATNLDPKATCPPDAIPQLICQAPLPASGAQKQVYVYDRVTRITRVVSVASDGTLANGSSYFASISLDGRYVSFTSRADNLVPNDHNDVYLAPVHSQCIPSCSDVFLHDRKTGKTELISVGRDGESADLPSGEGGSGGGGGMHQHISADNRYVAFFSYATDLVPNNASLSPWPVLSGGQYVRDRKTSRTERVSVDSTGAPLFNDNSPAISADGRWVTYDSSLLCEPPGSSQWVTYHDRKTGATEGFRNHPDCGSGGPTQGVLSGTGRYIAFIGGAADLVPGDTNDLGDIFVRDIGPELGTGGFGSHSRVGLEGNPGFSRSRFVEVADSVEETVAPGADLIAASLAYRPQYSDLFAAIELEHMPTVLPGFSPVFYGLRFEVEDRKYEVRATSLLGGTFGLFDCTGSRLACTKVTDLRGGYGTTGMRVVFSLSLAKIGLEDGGALKNVTAFSGLGTLQTGATKVLDCVQLAWTQDTESACSQT